jgi:hypothetical protein
MEIHEIEQNLARILAGEFILDLDNDIIIINNASRAERYRAQTVYETMYKNAVTSGFFTDDSLKGFLDAHGFWTTKDQNTLDDLYKDMEKLKVGLYESLGDANLSVQIRQNLATLKSKIVEFLNRKHAYDHLGCAGYANLCRNRYLFAKCVASANHDPVHVEDVACTIDKILEKVFACKLNESQLRTIALSDSWQTIWNASDHSAQDIFGVVAADLTDEQKSLVSLSKFYDSIKEHPDCPPDAIIRDDDILDGWIILQRRKRDKESLNDKIEKQIQNSKSRNADTIFIPVDSNQVLNRETHNQTKEERIKKVASLNDPLSQAQKRARMQKIRQEGIVDEMDMPDTKRELDMARTRAQIRNQ